MPVTRNLSPENTAQEECDEQICSIDNPHVTEESLQTQALDITDEVSSTTDSMAGTNMNPASCMEVTDNTQTASSLGAQTTDILNDQRDESACIPSSSTCTHLTNISRGFQDAFAAFASASVCRDPGEEEIETGISNSQSEQVAVVDSVGEPPLSSGDYSSQVSTSGEPFVTHEADEAVTQTQSNQSVGEICSDSVYFIQTTDASGQVVTSIIDPNDISSYSDSVVYRQCMKADGEIETTIVHSGSMAVCQEEHSQEQEVVNSGETQQGEQLIYAHDPSGQLTPIDPIESANDVAPPGKQFVYMQDSTGRIIRAVIDANQTMVPGQQVYYTQSDDGKIITSVMDSATTLVSEDGSQEQQSTPTVEQVYQPQVGEADMCQEHQQQEAISMVERTSGFNIDNSMSGLTMLAELSHLTAGQVTTVPGSATEQRTTSSTDSSNSNDMDEFRPVAMVTRRLASEDGVESLGSDIAELKVGEADSDSFDQSSLLQGDVAGPAESIIARIVSEMTQPSYTVSRDNLFVQWQNLDAMCWMDVVLIMLVYSPTLRPLVNLEPSHELASTLLITLLKANRQAQILLQNLLKKSNGAVVSDVQTGAGNLASIQDPKTSRLVCKENMDEIGKAINILYAMREKIWQGLQPRLRCERGKHNSPVLVLPLLVREKPDIKQMFTMSYRYVFKCEKCSYSQDDRHTKILPSIPAVPDDFNMKEPCFVRNCFECKAPNQRMMMKFEQLQDFVQMHFVKGLPHSRFEDLSFDFNGDHYEVTTVVHYKNNPDHFIAWVRNAPGPAWMECDDLKSVITRYQHTPPSIPPSQVHMVMWERRLTPQHTLIMRDTEDTQLLASLVLTVQQPNSHPPIESGTTTAATTTQASPTNLLMTQTITPYTSRGRGRGRGSRGSYGNRSRAATTTTPVIRRVSPAVTQVLSPSSPVTSPQIVRLPLSALAGSGLNLRGNTSGATRYVLIGNSSQAGTATGSALNRTGTPSKVVVVRSQGGASNISAAQLLQLLQKTGAISQVGSRFTTTLTTSGVNNVSSSTATTVTPSTTAATTSFIIQPDGSITATTISKDASLSYSTPKQITEVPMETETANVTQNNSEQTPPASLGSQTISTLPFCGAGVNTSEQTLSSHVVQSSGPETFVATSQSQTGNKADISGQQTATISQQSGRCIQIPNPAGGGMLTCVVGMRDGKIVLVPIDKNSQAKVAGQSILKVTNTSATSPKISLHSAGSTTQMLSTSSAGSVLAQLQKQLTQAHTSSSSVTSTGPQFITLPSGNKRIQLITVPRGQSDQSVAIMSGQQVVSDISSRLVSSGESPSADSCVLSQSSNIVIREVKKPESDNVTTSATSLCSSSDLLGGYEQLSTPAVSLLKDVSARLSTSTSKSSLLTCLTEHQKPPESFRYILPGSSTTHILHTGPTGAQAGKIFTALSSSGTIIGGQLTPSPGGSSTVGTNTVDQELIGDSDNSSQATSILTAKRRLSKELDTTEYIPLGSNRGRGRGGRGRARSQVWNSDAELIAPASANCRKISTLSDLRQIGAHIIEATSEAVDGIPVVSIPDYSTESGGQNEILSAAHSIISDIDSVSQEVSNLSHSLQAANQEATTDDTEARVITQSIPSLNLEAQAITQSIPSLKVNHGFDILTQGILGAENTAGQASVQKQAHSLLTGTQASMQSASSLLASLSETTASLLTATSSQAEIETLMQAAQAAARPSEAKSRATSQLIDSDFNVNKPMTYSGNVMNGQEQDIVEDKIMSTDVDQDMSIDDNEVSAAERYRMPMELFQPDEESPEKSVKLDDNRMAAGHSPNLFHNSDDSLNQVEIEMSKSVQQQNKEAAQETLRSRLAASPDNGEQLTMPEVTTVRDVPSPSASVEAMETKSDGQSITELLAVQSEMSVTPRKVSSSRGRSRGSTNKRGCRRKLVSAIVPEPMETNSKYPSVNETLERFTHLSSPVKQPLQNSASSDSLVNIADKEINILKDEGAADDVHNSHSELGNDVIVTPRKVGRPRGRPKGSGSKHKDLSRDNSMESGLVVGKSLNILKDENVTDDVQGGHSELDGDGVTPRKIGKPRGRRKGSGNRKKLDSTSVYEHGNTSQSAVTLLIETNCAESTTQMLTQASSPDKEYLPSIVGDIVTDSLTQSDGMLEKPADELKDEGAIDNSPGEKGQICTTINHGGRAISNIDSKLAATSLTEVNAHTVSAVMSSEKYIEPSSPDIESPQPSSSTERLAADSLLVDKTMAGSGDHSDKARPDANLTMKKVGRPRGRPNKVKKSKQLGIEKSYNTSDPDLMEVVDRFDSTSEMINIVSSETSPTGKSVEMLTSETSPTGKSVEMLTSETSPTGKSVEMLTSETSPTEKMLTSETSPTGKSVEMLTSETSPTGKSVEVLTSETSPTGKSVEMLTSENKNSQSPKSFTKDSFMESDGIMPKSCHTTIISQDNQQNQSLYDSQLTPKKGCRSRRRTRGIGRWRSIGSIVANTQPEETIATCSSDATSAIKLNAIEFLPEEPFATVTNSLEKECLKLSTNVSPALKTVSGTSSIEHFVTDLTVTEIKPEKPNNNDVVDLNKAGLDTTLTPEITGRSSQRHKSGSGKHKGKWKSDSSSISEFEEIVGTCPLDVLTESSTHAEITQIPSTHISVSHPEMSRVASIGETVTWMDCDNSATGEQTEALQSDHLRDVPEEISKIKTVSPSEGKENLQVMLTLLKKPDTSSAIVCYRQKVNWGVNSSFEKKVRLGSVSYNYKVLSSRRAASHTRHPSLGPVQDSFTIPPSPLPSCKTHRNNSPTSSPALVKRRQPKLRNQSLRADSSKQPKVIPLIVKDGSDAACTGGSVVASPSGEKIFTGVLVDYKRVKADWSCFVSEPEEALDYISEKERKTAQRKYCKQLMTVLYMEAGDFTAAVDLSSSCQHVLGAHDEAKQEIATSSLNCQDSNEAVDGLHETKSALSDKTELTQNITFKKKKRYSVDNSEVNMCSHPAKRTKSMLDEGRCHVQNLSGSVNTSSVDTPSRINDVDIEKSLTQSPLDSEHGQQADQREATNSAASSFSFPSPTRRSGRTPIPSKKVLDSLEDTPFFSLLKVRRASSVSSDDTQSGCSGSDMPQEKGNITS